MSRLDHEFQKGWVQRYQNKGWTRLPNSDGVRTRLGWVDQSDGRSCGPLAVMAALLALQGLVPAWSNINGFESDSMDGDQALQLREMLLLMLLAVVHDTLDIDTKAIPVTDVLLKKRLDRTLKGLNTLRGSK